MLYLSWAAVGGLALNVVISVLSSWAVAAIYFRKETRAEKIGDQIRSGLQKALFPIIYPQFFDDSRALKVHPLQSAPRDKDIPYVEYALFNKRSYRPGERAEVLLKLLDLGFDLLNPDGVTVRDHLGNAVGVVSAGLGYARVAFHIADTVHPGSHDITVQLQDLGEHKKSVPNANVQTLQFVVAGGDRD
ncbi:MAG: hypothetical protein KGJ78_10680 [Alphaproteobacteria bacterium]|nr:hypothetical protein [Alphaproteobacteria bacterium]